MENNAIYINYMKLFNLYPKYLSVFEKDINGREINIYKFNNCIPTGINTYYPNILLQAKSVINAELIQPIYERTMSLDNAYLNAATKTSVSECARRRKLSQRESRKQSSLRRNLRFSKGYKPAKRALRAGSPILPTGGYKASPCVPATPLNLDNSMRDSTGRQSCRPAFGVSGYRSPTKM
jgi:hypothetical protein